MSIHGTFYHSLLKRPVWSVLEPVFKASDARLQGCESQGYCDFSFILSGLRLHILLLTPSSLDASNKQDTISRLERFSSLIPSTTSKNAIAFLLSEDPFTTASGKCNLNGLLALQVTIIESLATYIPIVLVPDASCFLASIQEYMNSFVDLPLPTPSLADSMSLLSNTTASVPPQAFSEQDTNILSDLFPSLRALSQAIRSQEGQIAIKDYLGDEVTRGLVGFWDKDWKYE